MIRQSTSDKDAITTMTVEEVYADIKAKAKQMPTAGQVRREGRLRILIEVGELLTEAEQYTRSGKHTRVW